MTAAIAFTPPPRPHQEDAGAGRFLNQHCAPALDFESMFRAEMLKILLQQYRHLATGALG